MTGKFKKMDDLSTPLPGQMNIDDLKEAWEAERQLHEAQQASMRKQPAPAEAAPAAPEDQVEDQGVDMGEGTLVIGPEMLGFYKLLRAYNAHLPYEGYLVPEALSVMAYPDRPAELTITIMVSLPGSDDLEVDDN